MFGGHLPELVVLLVAALVIFGPKRLPEIGGAMGKGIKEFRKGTTSTDDEVPSAQTPVAERPAQLGTTTEVHVSSDRGAVPAASSTDREGR